LSVARSHVSLKSLDTTQAFTAILSMRTSHIFSDQISSNICSHFSKRFSKVSFDDITPCFIIHSTHHPITSSSFKVVRKFGLTSTDIGV
jgi:hypothetical protein